MMKHSKTVKQRLGKAPTLAAIKKYVDDERQIYRPFGIELDALGSEDAFPQRAEGGCRGLHPAMHVGVVSETVVDQ